MTKVLFCWLCVPLHSVLVTNALVVQEEEEVVMIDKLEGKELGLGGDARMAAAKQGHPYPAAPEPFKMRPLSFSRGQDHC